MDKIIENANFHKTELRFYPVLGLDDKTASDLGKYLSEYKKSLVGALAMGSVPIISTEPGLGFSCHTQEILSKEYGASVITMIEPRLIMDGYEAANIVNGIREQHAKDRFVIINDILSGQPHVIRVLLDAVTNNHDNIRFLISVYEPGDAKRHASGKEGPWNT